MCRKQLFAFVATTSVALAIAGCGGPSNIVTLEDDEPEVEANAASAETLAQVDRFIASQNAPRPVATPAPVAKPEVKTEPVKQVEPKFDPTGATVDLSECENYPGDKDLARWSKVKVVRGKGALTAGALNTFAAAPALTEFLWSDAVVDDASIEAFARVANGAKLKKVRLTGLKTQDGAFPTRVLQALASSPALADLDISGAPLTSNELKQVDLAGGFKSLVKLNLYQTQVGDAGVDALLALTDRLTSLNLDDAGISSASAAKIATFSKLTFLHVGRSKIDDAGVAEFEKLTKLEKIHITRSEATEAGADKLRKALPGCVVVSQPEN